jgi:hypothetical protein
MTPSADLLTAYPSLPTIPRLNLRLSTAQVLRLPQSAATKAIDTLVASFQIPHGAPLSLGPTFLSTGPAKSSLSLPLLRPS